MTDLPSCLRIEYLIGQNLTVEITKDSILLTRNDGMVSLSNTELATLVELLEVRSGFPEESR